MLSARMSLGIAQTAFYVPAVALAVYFFVKFIAKRPRMAWWPFIPLSLMRLAGGIVTIVLEKNPHNEGLIIAAIILLNVGAIPLVVATLGQIRIILIDNFNDSPTGNRIAKNVRFFTFAAIICLSSGGGVATSDAIIARVLSIIGYAFFATILAILIAMELYFFRKRQELIATSQKILTASLLAAPFLVVRTVYAMLEVVYAFNNYTSTWDPLYGNLYTFAFMCLLTEYICICIYFYLGFSIPADRDVKELPRQEHGYASVPQEFNVQKE